MATVKDDSAALSLLRMAVIGSVDDGKSTLIGRLLYDTKSIFEDQLLAIEQASQRLGNEEVNLALLTDGLRAEREQGITIDVAYRYATTPKRKFIIADCPGHIQYTRNMVTGTSSASLAIVLVDARAGVMEQTKRHAFISSLMQVKHLVICINKMDLVDFSEAVYDSIKEEFSAFMSKMDIHDIRFIPVSALKGDNIVEKSDKMPWYQGSPLLETLENIFLASDYNFVDSRFPVQKVIRPIGKKGVHDYRGYAGAIEGGVFKPGDEVMAIPSGFKSKIKSIGLGEKELSEAYAPMSVVMTLEDELDISRGDMIVKPKNVPEISQDLDLMVCWLDTKPMQVGRKYIVKHTTNEAKCLIKGIQYKINIQDLHKQEGAWKEMDLNEIGRISIRTTKPLYFDRYTRNKNTGGLIIIDEFSNTTVAAGLIL